MNLPDYWLQCPKTPISDSDQAAFDQLISNTIAQRNSAPIDYALTAPKWQFLNYLVDHYAIVLHGSGNPDIAMFEPRKPLDSTEFGSQEAVFAAADGVWAMFFAIIDRDQHALTISNGCIQFVEDGSPISDPYYLFSISQGFLQQYPWRRGTIYLLPAETFVEQPAAQFGELTLRIKQLASLVSVEPIAKIEVGPEDFPFLEQVREHDDSRMEAYVTAIQTGGAWPD